MDSEFALKIVTLLRIVAFMVFAYLGFGLLVERYSRNPASQVKAFARTVCSPVTRPVSRFVAPGTSYRRILLTSMGVTAVFWLMLVVLARALAPA